MFSNSVNTQGSMLTQAGKQWEGDIALNLENINDHGLIEIYETVLNRGKMLSIDAGINYGPANDALLLAAGYMNDLYMMVGNDSWADAANPTIGIGTKDRTYGDITIALFAFKGRCPACLRRNSRCCEAVTTLCSLALRQVRFTIVCFGTTPGASTPAK